MTWLLWLTSHEFIQHDADDDDCKWFTYEIDRDLHQKLETKKNETNLIEWHAEWIAIEQLLCYTLIQCGTHSVLQL